MRVGYVRRTRLRGIKILNEWADTCSTMAAKAKRREAEILLELSEVKKELYKVKKELKKVKAELSAASSELSNVLHLVCWPLVRALA